MFAGKFLSTSCEPGEPYWCVNRMLTSVPRLDIEPCDKCRCDSLTFTEGRLNMSYCRRQTSSYLKFLRMVDGDPDVTFPSNKLYVRFSSDDTVSYRGFNFTFVAGADTCKLWLQIF